MQTKTSLTSTLLFALFITISWSYNVDQETNNLILTNTDFNAAVDDHQYLLVNFYALWCKYSKQLKPEWVSVSKTLHDKIPELKTAQVEAYDNKDVTQQYKIEGTPTIKIFINKQAHDYKGLNNATQILEFVDRKLKKSLTEVADTQTVDSALNVYEWIGILVGGDTVNENVIKDVAFDNSDIWFVKTGTGEVAAKYGQAQPGSFILVNNITGSFDVYTGSLSGDAVTQFIKDKKFPSVSRFSKGTAEKIFYGDDPAMILIKSSENGDQSAETAFKTAAQSTGKNIFMTIASYDEEIGRLLCRQLGIEQSELPTVRIVKAGNDRVLKYYLDGTITADSINQFYQDYTNKKAKRFYLSEPVPQNNDLVTKVVGKTYDQIVNNPNQDVLLFITVPWCSHCVALYPIYDNVARKMHNVDNFVVAKIDASENDLEVFGLDVLDFPTILLFPKDAKSSPILKEGEKDEYGFDRFIRAHATVDLAHMKGPNPFNKDEL